MNTTEKACFCPRCQSPLVTFSTLDLSSGSSLASCTACGWKGEKKDLMTTVYQHDGGTEDMVLRRFVSDFKLMISGPNILLPLSAWLNKWGFLPSDARAQHKTLHQYMTAVAQAAIKAILETRAELEKQKANVP